MHTWFTAPISPTCERFTHDQTHCGAKTMYAYKSVGRGWMALCIDCALPHSKYVTHIDELLRTGETLEQPSRRDNAALQAAGATF